MDNRIAIVLIELTHTFPETGFCGGTQTELCSNSDARYTVNCYSCPLYGSPVGDQNITEKLYDVRGGHPDDDVG